MNDRCGIKRWLEWVPAWMLTGVVALAIAWLTLAPVPPEAVHLELFKGADKWVHAIMFGALTSCIMLDRHPCNFHGPSWIGISGANQAVHFRPW